MLTNKTSQLIDQIQPNQTNHMQTSQPQQTVFPLGPGGPGGQGGQGGPGNATGLFDQMRQTDSMPDMAGMAGTNANTTTTTTTTTGKPVPIVGVLAGVVAVVVIALIVVVVYFVAVRKNDCTACSPKFDFTDQQTFVSCNSSSCQGSQSPWVGHWCTSVDPTGANTIANLSGDILYQAQQAMSGVAAPRTKTNGNWQPFATVCQNQSCIGASIFQVDGSSNTYTITPCLAPLDGSANTTTTKPSDQPINSFLLAPKTYM